VLVTGSGGFLGANVVWALREHGLAVRALVRRPPVGQHGAGLDGVEHAYGDICDAVQVSKALDGISHVIHVAAVTALVPRPRRAAYRVNVEGTHTVCAAALRAGVKRLVYTSSVSTVAAGTAQAPATELSRYNLGAIRAPYYASKRQAEQVVGDHARQGLATVVLCPAYLIGPRDFRPTTNQLLLYFSRRRRPFAAPGGMNMLDVREAALAHVRALWMGEPGDRYLLAGTYHAYADLADRVQRIQGVKPGVRVLPRWTYLPGCGLLAIASGLWPWWPQGLSVPSFQFGFVPFHVSGAKADAAFRLTHRPIEQTVLDTLRWFQETGQAPWLGRLSSPTPFEDSGRGLARVESMPVNRITP
jgi:nucleoside-diphosphate-sugar epimerase